MSKLRMLRIEVDKRLKDPEIRVYHDDVKVFNCRKYELFMGSEVFFLMKFLEALEITPDHEMHVFTKQELDK